MGEVIVPELGEGIHKAVIAYWHVKPGDLVKADDDIVELMTDKAVFNVTAGLNGRVKEIYVNTGSQADIGEALALIDTTGSEMDA